MGSLVVGELFGEGVVRGTIPLEHGDGVNVLIDWLGAAQNPIKATAKSEC